MTTCGPTKVSFGSGDPFIAIVRAYREKKECGEIGYWEYFRDQRGLAEAIVSAAEAEFPKGKRFSHQRRIPGAVLREMSEELLAARKTVGACKTFDQLLQLVDNLTHDIAGIGHLTVYDTAHRLGAYLGLRPDFVYLHAGTRIGARALGLDHKADKLPARAFPKAFQVLLPEQIEDCLCIYKRQLEKLARAAL